MRIPLSSCLLFTIFCTQGAMGTLRLSAQSDPFVQRYAAPAGADGRLRADTLFYLVRFPSFPGEAVLNRLQKKRSLSPLYHIVQYPPADTLVKRWPANDNWKATEQVLDKLEKLSQHDSITVMTNAVPPVPLRLLRWEIPQQAALVRVAKKDWTVFISQPAVHMADLHRQPKAEAVINTANYTLNRISTLQQRLPALRGEQMRLSVKETLFDTADIDLLQRYIPTNAAPVETAVHATIMATLAGGAGNSGRSGKGVAPGIRIASADFNRLLPEAPGYFSQYNIHAQNHSYGTGIENYYGLEAVAYDDQVHTADTLLHIFSSGNSGEESPAAGLYSGLRGFANLTGTFKQSKNVIVTGGTDSINRIPGASSKGPAYDGRIKPEIAAYGADGTSGAAALVSGTALLLQESYRSITGQMPSAAQIKAVLVNSADDIGTPGPDYQSGFGALNAWQAVQTIRERRFASATVTNGNGHTQILQVPAGSHLLRVTMSYNDPPAAANATKALVNDLDLHITDAAGNRYAPWVLSSAPSADSLLKPARTGRDSLNNTEQVCIRLPAAGAYTITVRAHSITTASQRVHLAWQLVPGNHFDWQHPAAGEVLPAGTALSPRWQTSFSGPGRISLSTDKGATWQVIAENVPLEQGYTTWSTPAVFTAALLKMEQGTQSFTSDTFSISPPLQVHTGFDCKDSALLYWNKIPGAAFYRIYALNGPYFSPYGETADTVLLLQKNGGIPHVFAVGPVGGLEGERSRGIDFTKQGLDCYIHSFTADLTNTGQIQLNLELGSTWQIKDITWERQGNSFSQTPVTGTTVYTATDDAPPEGIVYYRVKLTLTGGRVIYSNAIPVQVLTNNAYMLFPNPAGAVLHVLARRLLAQEIRIMDVQGRAVRKVLLQNLLQPVSLQGLPAGIYWCVVYSNGQKVFAGKFVKM